MGRGTEHCHERCRRKTQVCLNKYLHVIRSPRYLFFYVSFIDEEHRLILDNFFILFHRGGRLRKIFNILLTFLA